MIVKERGLLRLLHGQLRRKIGNLQATAIASNLSRGEAFSAPS